ncbi:AraC family transcriptional regulator [soil metagenome]
MPGLGEAASGISVALLRPIAELLGRLDEDEAGFLAGLGITEASPPNAYISGAQVDASLDALARRRDDPSFALTLATTAAIRPLGLFGHMVWLSGTVRDAIERAAKRYQLVTLRTQLALVEHADFAVLRSTPVATAQRPGRILSEFPFASLAIRARETTKHAFQLRAMRFAHPCQASVAYDEVFRAPVSFDAGVDEFEVDHVNLALPLTSADSITGEVLDSRVAQLTASASAASTPFPERVRKSVVAHPTGEPAPDEVARELGVSARTLRRHLEQEGTSLRAVVDEVRRGRADELLAAGRSVKEVAFALGFSEPSAFSRAYKRWTGKAPSGE